MSARTQRTRRERHARRSIDERQTRDEAEMWAEFSRNADPVKVQAAVEWMIEGMRAAAKPFTRYRQFADASEPEETWPS